MGDAEPPKSTNTCDILSSNRRLIKVNGFGEIFEFCDILQMDSQTSRKSGDCPLAVACSVFCPTGLYSQTLGCAGATAGNREKPNAENQPHSALVELTIYVTVHKRKLTTATFRPKVAIDCDTFDEPDLPSVNNSRSWQASGHPPEPNYPDDLNRYFR
jgi:hypothetical protein